MKHLPSALLYYLVILPVSKLPYPVLYFLSDVLFVVFYYLLGYRMKVIAGNIDRSFPDRSAPERKAIVKKFYRHFCDLIVESLKVFSITEQQVNERFVVKNPEIFDRFFDEGRSVILAGGHYNNWELFAVAIDQPLKHQAVAVYKPLTNLYFDQLMRVSRGKYGLKMIPVSIAKKEMEKGRDQLSVFILATDQSPGKKTSAYWLKFLQQDTAVLFGTEKYAAEYNFPVVYGCIQKRARGYYEVSFELVHDQPASTSYGNITEAHTKLLERDILRQPEYWLWSHRRWKHTRPVPESVHAP